MRNLFVWCARAVAFFVRALPRGSSTVFPEPATDGGESCDDGDGGDSGCILNGWSMLLARELAADAAFSQLVDEHIQGSGSGGRFGIIALRLPASGASLGSDSGSSRSARSTLGPGVPSSRGSASRLPAGGALCGCQPGERFAADSQGRPGARSARMQFARGGHEALQMVAMALACRSVSYY